MRHSTRALRYPRVQGKYKARRVVEFELGELGASGLIQVAQSVGLKFRYTGGVEGQIDVGD